MTLSRLSEHLAMGAARIDTPPRRAWGMHKKDEWIPRQGAFADQRNWGGMGTDAVERAAAGGVGGAGPHKPPNSHLLDSRQPSPAEVTMRRIGLAVALTGNIAPAPLAVCASPASRGRSQCRSGRVVGREGIAQPT
jgi:hypothetical protein